MLSRTQTIRALCAFSVPLWLILISGCGVRTDAPAPAALPKSNSTIRLDDPELDAAIAKARQGLDGFIKRLHHPQRGEVFAVEGAYPAPDGSHEHLWIGDVTYKDGSFTGIVTSRPVRVAAPKYGDTATIKQGEITDWAIYKGGRKEGGFTTDLLLNREGQPR